MSNELMNRATEFDVGGSTVKLSGNIVKQYLVSGNGNVSDQEVVMFINLCKFQQLNPFLNEAYLVKFGNQPAQIIVSKEAFMKRAEMNKEFKGVEAGIIVEREGKLVDLEGAIKLSTDKLIGAYAHVYRSDRDKPITVRISLEEFGKSQATWKQMPMNMIRKTAIVNALREAFPNNVGAMYTEEEVQQSETYEQPIEEVIKQHQAQQPIAIPKQDLEESATPIMEQKEKAEEVVEANYTEVPTEDPKTLFDTTEEDPF